MAKQTQKKINLGGKRNLNIRVKEFENENTAITNMMMDPRYLRQSSTLIQDALQKGFDVLQLANGDIVCTGTKTIVHRYSWDEDKGKLGKLKTDKKSKKDDMDIDADEFEDEDA